MQYCGSVSGIWCHFNPWITGSGMGDKNQDPGSGIFLTLDPRWKNSDPGSEITSGSATLMK
jgi:hypothetical protein